MKYMAFNIASLCLCCPCFALVLLWYWSCNETQTNQRESNNNIFNDNLCMWSRSHAIKWEWFYGKETCHCITLSKSGRYNQTNLMLQSSLSVALWSNTHTCSKLAWRWSIVTWWNEMKPSSIWSRVPHTILSLFNLNHSLLALFYCLFLNLFHEKPIII